MKIITSKQNSIYKLCLRLARKKYRDETGLYIIEGPNLVCEAGKCKVTAEYIIIDESCADHYSREYPDAIVMASGLFRDLAQTDTPQGILALVHKQQYRPEDLLELLKEDRGNVIILDRLQDPGNIGTIIRTADAAGVKAILLVKGTGDIYAPKVVRAAAGSVFRIPAMVVSGGAEIMDLMRRAGRRVYATVLEDARWYYDEDLSQGAALIIGNEGKGISQELIDCADARIKIPMQGNIESLNAGVAAAILMYEAVRPRT